MSWNDIPDGSNEGSTSFEPPVFTDTAAPSETRDASRFAGVARLAAVFIAGLLVGGGAIFAVEHNSPSDASAATNGPAAFGSASNLGASGGPGGGDVAGEQHIQGTVTATTAST